MERPFDPSVFAGIFCGGFKPTHMHDLLIDSLGLDREARVNRLVQSVQEFPGKDMKMKRSTAAFLIESAKYPLLRSRVLLIERNLSTMNVTPVD